MGQETFEDDVRSGWPVEVITKDKVVLMEELVLNDQHLKVKEMAAMTNLSDTIARRILQNYLHMHKVSSVVLATCWLRIGYVLACIILHKFRSLIHLAVIFYYEF